VYTALTRVKRLQDLHVSDYSLKEAEMRLLALSRQVE
jgi:hypothetical protein